MSSLPLGTHRNPSCRNTLTGYAFPTTLTRGLGADLDEQESFKGIVVHSAEYKSSSQWKGKNGVIVGTANTGQIALYTSCMMHLLNKDM